MRIGIVTGSFDLLHAGHINLLKKAKQNCDLLMVALHVDPSVQRKDKNKPIESILERQIKLKTCKYVDTVVIYETEADLSIIFEYFDIDVRFLGSDSKDGRVVTDEGAVPIEYIQSLPIHTSKIRDKIKKA